MGRWAVHPFPGQTMALAAAPTRPVPVPAHPVVMRASRWRRWRRLPSANLCGSLQQMVEDRQPPSRRRSSPPRASSTALPRPLATVAGLLPALVEAVGPNCEVVLHDFARLPNSIVAIAGNVTGRSLGGPTTDFGLEVLRRGATGRDVLGYESWTRDGRRLRSSTSFLRDESGKVVGCLCINVDISGLLRAQEILGAITASHPPASRPAPDPTAPEVHETFSVTVEELTVNAVKGAIAAVGIPLDLMKKQHKLEVVRLLEERGVFLIRDAVEYVAQALGISRFTIYNYFNELKLAQPADGRQRRHATARALPGMRDSDGSAAHVHAARDAKRKEAQRL